MSYCQCHRRPYSECPSAAVAAAMPRTPPPGNVFNVLELLERARIEAMRYEELMDAECIHRRLGGDSLFGFREPLYMRIAALVREVELSLRGSNSYHGSGPPVLRMHELPPAEEKKP